MFTGNNVATYVNSQTDIATSSREGGQTAPATPL